MAKRKQTDPHVKAAVVAALLAGQGITAVAKEYNMQPSTVWRWHKAIPPEQFKKMGVAEESREEFDELIADALRSILKTLKVSADFLRSAEGIKWIQEHSPTEYGTMVGILTDKGFRLLEAAEYADAGCAETNSVETPAGSTNGSVQ